MFQAIRLISWIALIAGFAANPAQAERRLALSVGIDVYDKLPAREQLQRSVNDAQAIAGVLGELGFETTVEKNVSRIEFLGAWQAFLNRLKPGDTAAVFFAGHGVEIGGLNYLLPRDVQLVGMGQDKVLAGASIRFNELMDDLRDRKVRVSLLIVDACRDNPFREGSGRTVGGARGLTRVEAVEGSFVMYSAGVGEQALDRLPGGADASPNSVYTRTLLPILKTPGLSLQDVALRVREEVVEVARGAGARQTPAYYDQLVGKLVLKAGVAGDTKPVVVPPQVSEVERDWAAVKDASSVGMLEAFISRHPRSFHASLAQARVAELRRIEEAKKVTVAVQRPTLSGEKGTPPEKGLGSKQVQGGTPDGSAVSVAGQWNWSAICTQTGNWNGGFVIRHGAGGAISGEFNQGHPGTFIGRIAGNEISFTRTGTVMVVAFTQVWTAAVSKGSMQGSFGDETHGRCTFRATRA